MPGDQYDKEDCREYRNKLENEIGIAHKRIDKMFYWMLAAIILVAFDIALKVHDISKKPEIKYIKVEEKDVSSDN